MSGEARWDMVKGIEEELIARKEEWKRERERMCPDVTWNLLNRVVHSHATKHFKRERSNEFGEVYSTLRDRCRNLLDQRAKLRHELGREEVEDKCPELSAQIKNCGVQMKAIKKEYLECLREDLARELNIEWQRRRAAQCW